MKTSAMKLLNPARCSTGLLLAGWLWILTGNLLAQEARGLKKNKETKPETVLADPSEEDPQAAGLTPEVSFLPYRVALLDKVHVNLPGGEIRHLQVSQEGTLDLDGEKPKVVGQPKEDVVRIVKAKFPRRPWWRSRSSVLTEFPCWARCFTS